MSDKPLVRSSSFDVRHFTRTAFGDHRDDVDTAAFDERPLDGPTLKAIAFMWNVERSATDTMRRILATSTAREARFTAFLTTWAFDKYWFACQLERILDTHDVDTDSPLPHGNSRYDRRDHRLDQISRLAAPVWTTLAGEPVAALHAVQGLAAVNAEIAAYNRLLELNDHQALKPVIDLLVERKRIHREFFLAEARMRLAGDTRAQRLTRGLLTHSFHPLRPGNLPAADSHWFLRFLLAEGINDGLVDTADSAVRNLPGMSQRGPLEAALRRERPIG